MTTLLTEARAIELDQHDPSPRLRLALVLQDTRCAFQGCDVKAEDCDLHHLNTWEPGKGLTTHDNLTALCRTHHRATETRYWCAIGNPTGASGGPSGG